jgi:mediator of RNA polymerase II transcription subunit 7
MGRDQLYPDSVNKDGDFDKIAPEWTLDRAKYLKRTVRSILLNFLELVDILSEDPVEADFKVQQISTLFINSHHMINEYRPHQAREALIMIMEEEIQEKKRQISAIKEMKDKMETMGGDVEALQEELGKLGNGIHREPTTSEEPWNALDNIGEV